MKRLNKGFTLVELLIVIALIAILSVAVLATINPIEQTNKARDAKFKNDAGEVLGAYERYYAAQNSYPWSADNDGSGSIDNDEVDSNTNGVAFLSTDWRFGVLGFADNTVNYNGLLMATSELKTAFSGKESFKSTVRSGSEDAMYVFHSNDNNYVCFCPKANANRTGAMASQLKCLSGITAAGQSVIADGAELLNVNDDTCAMVTDTTTVTPKSTNYCALSATVANMLCVPEGTIR